MDDMTFSPPGPYDVAAGELIHYTDAATLQVARPVPKPGQWGGPFPAVVIIHGGGWSGGTPDIGTGAYTGYSPSWARLWASWGFVAFSVGYRLVSRDNPWPACFEDCQAAVRYVRENAVTLGVNPSMIGAMGDSAGGQMAYLLGLIMGDHSHVQFVVSQFGPWSWGPQHPGALNGAPLIAADAAITAGVKSADTLIIQGTRDEIVRPDQGQGALAWLKAHNRPVHYLSYDGGHEFTGMDGATWMQVIGELQMKAVSFAIAHGKWAPEGVDPVIPADFAGPGSTYDDAA